MSLDRLNINEFRDIPDIKLVTAVNELIRGRGNNFGSVTLTANASQTTVTDSNYGAEFVVLFDPLTANAAAELYGGTMYVAEADRDNGQFIITHANNAQTDREFRYFYLG